MGKVVTLKYKTMKFNPKLIECLFGHHRYSGKTTIDKDGRSVRLCRICKRRALWYWFSRNGDVCIDYDEEGKAIRIKWGDGYELRKDQRGRWVE